jgi:hypothetical protein
MFVILFTFLGFQNSFADENTELMSKGMWKDPSTGLIWSRCTFGSSWNGDKCSSNPTRFSTFPKYSMRDT